MAFLQSAESAVHDSSVYRLANPNSTRLAVHNLMYNIEHRVIVCYMFVVYEGKMKVSRPNRRETRTGAGDTATLV